MDDELDALLDFGGSPHGNEVWRSLDARAGFVEEVDGLVRAGSGRGMLAVGVRHGELDGRVGL